MCKLKNTIIFINSLLPIVPYLTRLAKFRFQFQKGSSKKKKSYEHRDYESVDEKSLS